MAHKDAIEAKTAVATRWSVFSEIGAKLIAPVANMILARLLAPAAFGAVATLTVVVSFADVFTDAGFQKYIIQFNAESEDDFNLKSGVAFWSNLLLGLFIWVLIFIFRDILAEAVGSPGLGLALVVASSSVPLNALSSIQMARLRRTFQFKKLFYARLAGSCMPLVVTVPVAFFTRSFWALVAGTLATSLCNAIVLSILSGWKPSFRYSFSTLVEMFSYSWWVLLESISIWASSSLDTFLVGRALNSRELGLYKTGTSTVTSIMSLVTSSTSAPLFSALSRLQNDQSKLIDTFLNYTRAVAVFVIPLGVCIWLYSDVVTGVLLGSQWNDATNLVGMWGFASAICLVLGTYCNGLYNAVGMTRLSFFVQLVGIAVMVPVVIITSGYGYAVLCVGRVVSRFAIVLTQLVIMRSVFNVTPARFLSNVAVPAGCSILMTGVTIPLRTLLPCGLAWGFVAALLSLATYFLSMRIVSKDLIADSLAILGFNTKGGRNE